MKPKILNRPYLSALRVITKPFDSFALLQEKGYGAVWQPAALVILFFLARIFNIVFGGFLFNTIDISEVNLLIEFVAVAGIYFLFIIANKNFCDLVDGDGSLIEVALVTAYAILPYILSSFINIVLSNFLLLREQAFMQIITVIGLIWSLLVGLVGLKTIHRYSFSKTVVTVIITLIFIALIAFLGALIFLISQELVIFIKDIYNEIVFRI